MKPSIKECQGCHRMLPLWSAKFRLCKDCNFRLNPQTLKPRKKIAQFSEKHLNQLAAYRRLRKKFLAENPGCQAKVVKNCQVKSGQVHHSKGRLQYLNDVSTFIAICDPCHKWVELNPEKAKELGLSQSRLGNN